MRIESDSIEDIPSTHVSAWSRSRGTLSLLRYAIHQSRNTQSQEPYRQKSVCGWKVEVHGFCCAALCTRHATHKFRSLQAAVNTWSTCRGTLILLSYVVHQPRSTQTASPPGRRQKFVRTPQRAKQISGEALQAAATV